jgi:hypothetical protein
MTAPAADKLSGGGSDVFRELTTFYMQLDGTTFMGEYEVVDGHVLLSSADFGQASAGLDGQEPGNVAARLLRGMVGAAAAHGERFMRDDETNAPGA